MRIFDKNKLLEDFIKKAKIKHGDKYSYDLVEYKDNKTKIKIVCNKHGEFWQQPKHHLSGRNCIKCGRDACSKALKKTLDDSQISFLKDNVNKLTMSQLKKELGVCDTIIRKEMLKHKIKFKSHNYGPIYKDIPKYLWVNLNRGAKERNLIVEISPKDIWEVYIKQNKLCALSSIKIFFGKTKTRKYNCVCR